MAAVATKGSKTGLQKLTSLTTSDNDSDSGKPFFGRSKATTASKARTSYKTTSIKRSSSSGSTKGMRGFGLSRTVILRALLTFSLIAALVTCTAVSYNILNDAEQGIALQTYESIAASALTGAQAITERKYLGSEVMATLMSHVFPDQASWPLITMDGYIHIAESVAKLTDSTTQSLIVLLDPAQVTAQEFEDHTAQVYLDQHRPESAGFSDFGFGIWKPDPNKLDGTCDYEDCRLHDTSTGPPAWGGPRSIATPLMMHNRPGAKSLMYNLYSQANRGIHIDSMLDCVERAAQQEDANTTSATTSPKCSVFTDILELKVRPGPAGLLFLPIFPANDPLTFVGFATTSIHWEEVLTSVVPDYVNGLTCVVSTDTTAYTYEIREGIPLLMGEGDLHDTSYSNFSRTATLNPKEMNSGALSSAVYTLTVYPTAEMLDAFSTNSPLTVSLGFFVVVAFCALVFVAYDSLMRSEANQRDNILEMKRRFVRFISHEIRTPLNTCCMGLELLENELKVPLVQRDVRRLGTKEEPNEDCIEFLQNVTSDIRENAHTAVEILNDLLNYDKLEMGELQLETAAVSIWNLVERSVQQFQIQAVNRKIDLKLNLESPMPLTVVTADGEDPEVGKSPDLSTDKVIVVLGDDVKLGQVMRNLVSNACKFTAGDGSIEVSACHVRDGLPDAQPVAPEEGRRITYCRAGSIRITIKDTGAGLSPEQLQQLFGEGVQFDANRLQHGGGSGLGLSIAKGIVEQHHGVIWAESEGHGHGTTFFIELPLYEFTQMELKLNHQELGFAGHADTASNTLVDNDEEIIGGKVILVAEDSASSLKMLIRLLEKAGHTCIPAVNGQIAVDAVRDNMVPRASNRNHRFIDSILLDFEMPLVTGPDAATMIRKMGFEGTIIGVTGNVLKEDVDFFMEHGADEVLPKPISMAKIDAAWKHQSDGMMMDASGRQSSFAGL